MLRRTTTMSGLMVAFLLVLAMGAWACTNLASLNLSAGQGNAGATIEVHGSAFSTQEGAQEVNVRWDGTDGEVLASTDIEDASGSIATSVTIPSDAEPGYHTLVATQMVEADEGEESPGHGTPARASFLVGEAQPEEIGDTGPPTTAPVSASPSNALLGLTALLAILGLGLFGAGIGTFVRAARQRTEKAKAYARE